MWTLGLILGKETTQMGKGHKFAFLRIFKQDNHVLFSASSGTRGRGLSWSWSSN